MKDDYNINHYAPAPAVSLGTSVISGNHCKLYIEAQPRSFSNNNRMVYGLVVNNSNDDTRNGYESAIFGYMDAARVEARISNRGGMFFATGATGTAGTLATNIGAYGVAIGTGDFSDNRGGWFSASVQGAHNYGVYCSATDGTALNYALYAFAPTGACATGACTRAAGFFNGDVYTTSAVYYTSDATLKTNIQPFAGDSLLRLIPIHTFDYNIQNNFALSLPENNHYGVLSQEIEQVLPNLVKTFKQPEEQDSLGNIISQAKDIKAVNYNEFIPLLIAGYQKQANRADELAARLDSLIAVVGNCCNAQPRMGNATGMNNNLSVELENVTAIVLNQNEPNPFAEQTTITWNIPAQDNATLNAMLIFYDNTGTVLKTVKINETGPGSLLVYGSKLSTGIYTYSLVVNNNTIDSKRMLKTK
jgi:hypothetical protein